MCSEWKLSLNFLSGQAIGKKTDLYFLQAESMASELKGFFFNQIVVFNVFLL